MVSKVGVAIVGALGAGTVSYVGYEYLFNAKEEQRKVTIGEELSSFLLNTESSEKWAARKNKLSQASDSSLVEELKSLKSGITEAQVKNWCSIASTKVYSEVSSLYLENVRSYCTFHNEDKLPSGYIKSTESWDPANERLKKVNPDTGLSSHMKDVKDKLSKKDSSDANALKNWCVGVYEKPYLGEENQDFQDAKTYCSKVVESTTSVPTQ
ncbi:hypothetical protein MHC_02005 [Mycoplasma haemocanis str. Illinois]|uniref:Uncharacterized protein n=1 Tax=Mycoplasma haemocanis (strain Illinois) TaxID=1111676 RepID=H6N6J5_MYCHN|nr:hypothetical protein [Mycoplasma haemocanis]AEW45267.1 hypothetical protein MHC_02005 [Mycoplasma haemocanis str. Illinois]